MVKTTKLTSLNKKTAIFCNVKNNCFMVLENGNRFESFDFSKPVIDVSDFERELEFFFSKVVLNKRFPILFIAPDEFLFHTQISFNAKLAENEEKALSIKFKKRDDFIFDPIYTNRTPNATYKFFEVCNRTFYTTLNKEVTGNGYRLEVLLPYSQAIVYPLVVFNPVLNNASFVYVNIKDEFTTLSLVVKNNVIATYSLKLGDFNFTGDDFPANLLYNSIDFSPLAADPTKPNKQEINSDTVADFMVFNILHFADNAKLNYPSEDFGTIVISCSQDSMPSIQEHEDIKNNDGYKILFLNSFTENEIICKNPEFLGVSLHSRFGRK